jgi:FkbM family methyltransferase
MKKRFSPEVSGLLALTRRSINRYLKFDVVRFPWGLTLDASISEALSAHRIDAIIDVGANKGQFALRMRQLGYSGPIYSFEPTQQAYSALSTLSAKDSRWFTYNIALGRISGSRNINVTKDSVFSSFLDPNDLANARFGPDVINTESREHVEVTTLADFFDRNSKPIGERVLLKMDTQGFDLEVFAGAISVLHNIKCLLSEISFIPTYNGMPTYLEALAEYNKWGFFVCGIYPVTRNEDHSLVEADCLMVKREAAR